MKATNRAANRVWRRGLAALAVLVVTAVGTVATSQASVPKAPKPSATQPSATQASAQVQASKSTGIPSGSVVGTATGTLPEWFGPAWAGDRVRFDIDAHGNPMNTAGTFRVFHGVGTTGEARAEFEGNITCLTVAGPVAIATGVITDGYAHFPGRDNPDVTGTRVSFTVLDQGGHDRMYWAWGFAHAPINDCMGLAPMFRPSHGNIRVRSHD